MSAASLSVSISARRPVDRALFGAGFCTVAYLGLTSVPMARYAYASDHWIPFMAHLLALAVGATVLFSAQAWLRPLRDWLPLALGPFLYVELRWLIEGMGRP